MTTFAKILLPHDGSDIADKAIEQALNIAKHAGSKITFLYVIDERYSPPSTLLSFIHEKSSLKEAKENLRRILSTGVDSMFKDRINTLKQKGVAVDVQVAFGSPADQILKVAEKGKFDIIVMGTRSIKYLKKLRSLGSVARKVSESSSIPVMLVR